MRIDGEGPVVALGSDLHLMPLGSPGGSAIFSPDGARVLATYTAKPVGAWIYDATTGVGERMPWLP